MELHPKEANLIKQIRDRFQWGEVTITCMNGLPDRILKTHDYTKISSEFEEEV